MAIIVTGTGGFIGSHLVEKLLEEGYKVIGIDNFHKFYSENIKIKNVLETIKKIEKYEDILSEKSKDKKIEKLVKICKDSKINYELIYEDLRNLEEIEKIFKANEIEMIINLAGLAGVRPSLEKPLEYNEVNIGGYMNLLECAKKYGVKKFIQASSSSVYGDNKKVPFNETDIVDFAISPYAATKKSGEIMGHVYHSLYELDMLQFRFFTVYGPRQRPDLAIHKFVDKINKGEKIPFYGTGETYRDYTYVEDIIQGVISGVHYLEKNKNVYEIINLGGCDPISLKEMVETIETSLGKKALINILPMQPGDVERTYADITKANKLLGYEPKTKFQDGINKFVKWYMKGR